MRTYHIQWTRQDADALIKVAGNDIWGNPIILSFTILVVTIHLYSKIPCLELL
ncbi:hypothetical protein BJX70DRAFT_361860 [Aspergillus crustosus]